MLTVGKDVSGVERRLLAGLLSCPDCGRQLHGWGHGRERVLRGAGGIGWRLRPRRAICPACGRTHVLLPVSALARRADTAAVIGEALAQAAAGHGHRQIAERLGRPAGTVRGWLRRFGLRARSLRSAFTGLLAGLDPDPLLPAAAGSQVADAVSVILAVTAAVARRWGYPGLALSPWEVACAVTSGGLLVPGAAVELINTSRLW
jgi:transposase-like protein